MQHPTKYPVPSIWLVHTHTLCALAIIYTQTAVPGWISTIAGWLVLASATAQLYVLRAQVDHLHECTRYLHRARGH